MPNTVVHLAIEVANAALDAFFAGHQFPTIHPPPAGLARLLSQVREVLGEARLQVACEATGG